MTSFQVSLSSGENCNFNLVSGQQGENSVTINGKSYNIIADQKQIPLVKEILNRLPLSSIKSDSDLMGHIKNLHGVSNVSHVGTNILGTAPQVGVWKARQDAMLPTKIEELAEDLWKSKQKEDLSKLKQFLGIDKNKSQSEAFDRALHATNSQELAKFLKNFNLTAHDIWDIYNNEKLGYHLNYTKTTSYEITQEDLTNLKQYLNDIHFSGVVRLSDEKASYTITAEGYEKFQDRAFPMHSIGKVMTGAVILMTMPESAFNKPIELNPEDIKTLPKAEKEFLEANKPTLFQVMTHRGGLGDFLGNYEQAILDALDVDYADLPQIRTPEDLLKYSNSQFFPIGEDHYSNLSTVLAALAVQKHTGKPYEQTLKELLLDKKGINISRTQPDNAQFSQDDPCKGLVVGSPAGGHWATAEELHKVGTYLREKCLEKDGVFLSKVEKFGEEFYVPEDREIRHNGCGWSGSALLSTFLDAGITMSILSDQGNFMADKLYHTIRNNLVDIP